MYMSLFFIWIVFVFVSFMAIVAFGWRAKTRENRIFFITLPVAWLLVLVGILTLEALVSPIPADESLVWGLAMPFMFLAGFGMSVLFLSIHGAISGVRTKDKYLLAASLMPLLFLLGMVKDVLFLVVMGLYVLLTLVILFRKAVRAVKKNITIVD